MNLITNLYATIISFPEHLVEMLNFNLHESPTRPVWKLFVMDAAGQKILGPLIKVNDLREHGVTLFLQLKGHRERVPDVPVVYFVEPSTESIALICQVHTHKYSESTIFNILLGLASQFI